jgi:hypothetical protein
MRIKHWPNNHGRAQQHASYARQMVDGVIGSSARNVRGPKYKVSLILLALHDFTFANINNPVQWNERHLATQTAGLYEELTGEDLTAGPDWRPHDRSLSVKAEQDAIAGLVKDLRGADRLARTALEAARLPPDTKRATGLDLTGRGDEFASALGRQLVAMADEES